METIMRLSQKLSIVENEQYSQESSNFPGQKGGGDRSFERVAR